MNVATEIADAAKITLFTRCVVVLALCGLAVGAQAQDADAMDGHNFPVVGYDGDPRDPSGLVRAGSFKAGQWYAGGILEFAKAPVIFQQRVGEGFADPVAVLDNVFALNVSAGAAVHKRIRLDAALPIYFASTGLDGESQGASVGDLRLASLVSVFRTDDSNGYGLGLVPYLDLPTGSQAKWLGDGGLGGGFTIANTYESGKMTFTGNMGMNFRKKVSGRENINGADALELGLGVGYLFTENNGVTVEAAMSAPLAKNTIAWAESPAQWLASYRYHSPSGGHFMLGFGTALTRGAGAAKWRVVLGGGFGRFDKEAPKDTDQDGILDDVDTCPEKPETVNEYKDDDGCPDALGQLTITTWLPDGAGEVKGAKVWLADAEAGEKTSSPAQFTDLMPETSIAANASFECMQGAGSIEIGEEPGELKIELQPKLDAAVTVTIKNEQGETVKEAVAKWVTDTPLCASAEAMNVGEGGVSDGTIGAGTHTLQVNAEGYAPISVEYGFDSGETKQIEVVLSKVSVEKSEIVTFDKVHFRSNSDVIMKKSYVLLDQVANVIKTHPDFGRVEVAGHTDSDGSSRYNLGLSQRRAEAVKTYLIKKGVDGKRLIPKGYGESNPVAPNTTPDGKYQNRRVLFVLIDRSETP
jgi:outer membrane protein OmpA-like peptidoglycan-associated protein